MTVKEYNKEFLPKINRADYFILMFEHIIEHMDKEKVDNDEVWRIFKLYGWSEELKQTILTALEYYKQKEGLEPIYENMRRELKEKENEK